MRRVILIDRPTMEELPWSLLEHFYRQFGHGHAVRKAYADMDDETFAENIRHVSRYLEKQLHAVQKIQLPAEAWL